MHGMIPKREIHLLAYLKTGPTAKHMGGWRHPESELDDMLDFGRYEHIARVLEAACFDGLFFADVLGLHDIYKGGFDACCAKGGQISFLDPMMVLPVMARGDAAYRHRHHAVDDVSPAVQSGAHGWVRWILLSNGRVAWNVVTSTTRRGGAQFRHGRAAAARAAL